MRSIVVALLVAQCLILGMECSRLIGGDRLGVEVLDAPSGPNPGGNAMIKARILEGPSGPSPGGNSKVDAAPANLLGSRLDAPSGPNPGGNAEIHATILESSSAVGINNNKGKIDDDRSHKKSAVKNQMLDAPSGPSPGGNAFVQEAKIAAIQLKNKKPKSPTPNPGPSTGHNGVSMDFVGSSKAKAAEVVLASRLPKDTPTPGSGPNPGHNSVSKVLHVPNLSASSSSSVGCGDRGIDSHVFATAAGIFSHN